KPSMILNSAHAAQSDCPRPTMPFIDAELETRVSTAWSAQIHGTPAAGIRLAQDLARRHAVALVGHFYTVMLEDEGAAEFLSHQMVEQRLAASLQQWLEEVLAGGDAETIGTLIARQLEIGHVHARI